MKRTVIQHGDLTLTDKVPDSEKIRKMAADKMRTGMTKIKMYLKEPRSSDEMWCIFRVANPWEPPTADEEKAGNCGEQKTKKENGDRDRKQQNFSPGENRREQKTKKENGVRDRKQQNFSPGEEREGEAMEQIQLTEQIAMVQDMVQEMKLSFTSAMEELAKTQYGDESLQQQLSTDRESNLRQITELTDLVKGLKSEVDSIKTELKGVVNTQKTLEERLKSEKPRLVESPAPDSSRKDVAPMVQPYLASLHQQKASEDCDTHSVTALACKSLNLSQALHEKCLHLELSSSDEDDTLRNLQNSGFFMDKDGSYYLDDKHVHPRKLPLHERVVEEVQREKAAQEIVEAERSYCSQLWTLIDAYMNPLRHADIMTPRELSALFPSYIPLIYEQHCLQLHKMEERLMKWKITGMLGDIFVKMLEKQEGEGLALYKEYINDFPSIINSMNQWFSQSPHFKSLMGSTNLASSNVIPLLLEPLQQIPKYSLLLKNLLKHTAMDHPDRQYLEAALYSLKNFLYIMNSDIEHASQFLNVARSREGGNSMRSRSSGSSAEANQVSSARDSGIQEDETRHPASPNTTRRYVLQVLRERREREEQGYRDRPVSVPSRHHHTFGSHPDLSAQELVDFVNTSKESSVYLPYQTGHKMYSSLTKIPSKVPEIRSPEKPPRRIKIRRRPDNPKSAINSNYLRPLTPHFPFSSTPSHTPFDEQENLRPPPPSRRGRTRPASSIDFTNRGSERRDQMLDDWSFQGSSLNSPRDHPGEGRARNELHLSIHRLLAGRERDNIQRPEDTDQYFQPVTSSSEPSGPPEDRFGSTSFNGFQAGRPAFQRKIVEDYGIYGDEDDEEEYGKDGNLSGSVNSQNTSSPMKVCNESPYENFHQRRTLPEVRSLNSDIHQSHREKPLPSPRRNESQKSRLSDSSSKMPVERKNSSDAGSTKQLKPEHLVPAPSENSTLSKKKDMQLYEIDPSEFPESTKRNSYVQAEKPSEDEGPFRRDSQKNMPDINKNDLKLDVKTAENFSMRSPTQNPGSPCRPTSDFVTSGPVLRSPNKTAKKLPIPSGRLSYPNLDQMSSTSTKIPSPPVTPTDGKNMKALAKDSKIPMYMPKKKDKGTKGSMENLSKSSEDVSKVKKKTKFGSIKSFFGRKRMTVSFSIPQLDQL
uniref:Uncharacterized protein LOC111128871 isoform X6 n=1 Tax=Crassostrea virginica TaxID=6565 RepID=A0A8B8DU37_CRAVI|nr:uncharacterized protein LOC111128871 isoform X6 [Crassostrea virginica]XP_022330491.1 uncharacterized protein LOC111128871 isoform X6 [Crassostrea virginica]XP_022331038.1 uncharacterized protein LOC111129162 isoform X9 [Crassostrea virginica]XP_022331039.1 uncharacterized protein LOC111129162 isoform X9 [Crassostrea virginica]